MTATDPPARSAAMTPTRAMTRNGAGGRPRGSDHEKAISQLPYLPGLDGVRAIAVVAVMVYHANSDWLAGGYLGVEVFFVISGYLITLLLIGEHERSGSIDLKNFWIRRFRRLLPALFVMMLLLTVWVSIFERSQLGKLRGDVIAGALYVSNWYQIWIGAGYSAGADFAPLRHLWSLAVEEQFYVLWPLVMLVFVRAGNRNIARIGVWLFVAALAITGLVAFWNYPGPQQSPEFTPDAYWTILGRSISIPDALYLSTITRAGGLMLGAGFAMLWRPMAIMRSPLRDKAGMVDLAAVVGLIVLAVMSWLVSFQPDQGVGFLFQGGLFVTGLATLAVIAAVTHQGALTGRALSLPVLLWIGTRSYGLYLYHWPIYQIIRNIAAVKLQLHEFVLAMVATVIITELSYRYIETPIRQGRLSELWRNRGTGAAGANSLSPAQRSRALIASGVAALLAVFAVGSMATAELQQNDLAVSLEAAAEETCDVLRDLDCDGVDDLDADGNPIGLAAEDGEATPATSPAALPEAASESEGASTDSTTTTQPSSSSTLPPPPRQLALGDSVMLGAASQLRDLGYQVDAKESRAWVNGLDAMETLQRNGRLPEELVIHLGTNGPIGQENMDRMMAAVSSVPTVLLLTNDVDRDWTAGNNSLIFDAVAANDNVELLDWEGLAPGCQGDCFEADGFHLKLDGREYYAQLISEAIVN